MFNSQPPFTDLIFQDATTQLLVIPPEERQYGRYLGSDYMRARRIVDCHAGSISYKPLVTVVALMPIMIALYL